jgi:hypothetical protein
LACFQCGLPIETIEEFSIEHKEPWQSAANPSEAFFAIENLAFSHFACNVAAATKPHQRFGSERDRLREKYMRLKDEPSTLARRGRYNAAKRERRRMQKERLSAG